MKKPRIITPRTAAQLISRYGFDFFRHLPVGTLFATGWDEDAGNIGYYWTPVGTPAQDRMLAKRRVNVADAIPARRRARA